MRRLTKSKSENSKNMFYVPNKGYCEASGKKVMSKRQMALQLAKIAGYHDDSTSFTHLIVENRISRPLMNDAWRAGQRAKQNGVPCTCQSCQ
jgi:hypothetical protein